MLCSDFRCLFFMALFVITSVGSGPAVAQSHGEINWSGFWSMGMAGTDSEESFDGLNRRPSLFRNSLAGLNGNILISETWSATLQLLAKGEDDNFKLDLDWALLTWQPISSYTLRVGKQKVPAWLVSDHLDVGILLPWIKPPVEVYSLNPISTFIGMDHIFSWSFSEKMSLQVEVMAGSANEELKSVESGSVTNLGIRDAWGGNIALQFGPGTLRLSRFAARIEGTQATIVDTPCTVPTCGPAAPPGTSIRSTLISDISSDHSYFTGIGLKWDDRRTLFMSEYAVQKNEGSSLYDEQEAYYVTLGHYFGEAQQYLAHLTQSATTKSEGAGATGKQSTVMAGFNCFLTESMVAKLEWGQTEATEGNGQFDSDPGRKVNLLGLSMSAAF